MDNIIIPMLRNYVTCMPLLLHDEKSRKPTSTTKTNEKTRKWVGGVDVWVAYSTT